MAHWWKIVLRTDASLGELHLMLKLPREQRQNNLREVVRPWLAVNYLITSLWLLHWKKQGSCFEDYIRTCLNSFLSWEISESEGTFITAWPIGMAQKELKKTLGNIAYPVQMVLLSLNPMLFFCWVWMWLLWERNWKEMVGDICISGKPLFILFFFNCGPLN